MQKENIISTTNKALPTAGKAIIPSYKIPAQIFSFVFIHYYLSVIATWYLAFVSSGLLHRISTSEKWMIIIRVAYSTIFFPALTVLLRTSTKIY